MSAKKFGDDDSKIIIRDENGLGVSAYYDEDEYYYRDDDYYSTGSSYGNTYVDYYNDSSSYDDRDVYVDYYKDSSGGTSDYYYYGYNGYNNRYNSWYPLGSVSDYYDDWYDDYYDDDWDDDDYYDYYDDYDDDDDDDELILDGATLKVGSDYDDNIWLNEATGDLARVRVIDAEDNRHSMFIAGNSHSNSIISGSGQTSLWGGGGSSNTLIGGSRRNYFWYYGNSRDVAVKFGTGDTDRSDVVVINDGQYSSINRDSASITFYRSDGKYIQLQPDGASNDDDPIFFSANGRDLLKMKIAKNTSTNLTYSNDVKTFYFMNSGQLIVNGSNNNVWLGGEAGQNYVNVSTINGAGSSGYNNVFSGSSSPNVIYGGSGYSTLWGGSGVATDTLVGGQGPEVFRVGKNDGSDEIYTDEGHDVIFLYDANLSDITYAGVNGSVVSVGFNTGTFVNLHNTAQVSSIFQLSNGERYNYNRSTGQWQGA
ncbi:MAG: hypothetical protein IJT06_01145 [Selenomonadaceae bacterium]|nr:hypothetical protein [Selenomonadaceae bacterium]